MAKRKRTKGQTTIYKPLHFFVLFFFVLCLVYGCVQHILWSVFCFVCFRLLYCVPNVVSFSRLSILNCPLRYSLSFIHQDKQNKKHNTICVRHNHTQDTRPRQTKQKTQHNMCWTPPYTRHKTKRSK
jgi:hypothetical protein